MHFQTIAGTATPQPTFNEALRVWLKIGLLSFGGPAGQIALMHRVLVDEKKWIDEPRYLSALNFCMLLPGPEAMQLATYVGWRLHGLKGGLAAGLLFVLPGALVVLALSMAYAVGTVVAAAVCVAMTALMIAVLVTDGAVTEQAGTSREDWVALAVFTALSLILIPTSVFRIRRARRGRRA